MFFFKKRSSDISYAGLLSFMETDIHSHLIPAVDDGVQDIETSLLFIQQLQEMGIQKVITTPHIMADRYPNSVQTLTAPYMQVKKVLQEKGIDLAFSFAGEYYMDEYFEQLISSSSLLTLQGKMVLVEMSFIQAPPQLHQWLFSLIAAGYQPVLAHPERYNHYHDNYTQYAQLKEWGCQLQMNLLSITGYYGKHVQKIAERLLADKMIDLVGTDMHHQKHLQAIKSIKTNKKAFKLLEGYNFKNKELTNT